MPVNVGEIVDTIQACVAGSPADQELAQLSGAITNIEAGDIYSVACAALLPDAAENIGRWVYVTDIGAYRYSDGYIWTNAYDTTCGINYGFLLGGGSDTYAENLTGDACYTQTATGGTNWSFVACGTYIRASALRRDGTLWNWGYRSTSCGTGDSLSPVQEYLSSTDWCYVDAGEYHTQALKTDGTMWGYGGLGYFETWTNTNTSFFVQECGCNTFIDMTAGARITHAIKSDGSLWSQGLGCHGSLGNNVLCLRTCSSPVQEMTSSTNWCCVSTGNNWNVSAIKSDGTMWGWGYNPYGTIGDNTNIYRSSPVQEITSSTDWCGVADASASLYKLALKTDGTIWSTGRGCNAGIGVSCDYSSPVQEITSSTSWIQAVAIGPSPGPASSALKTDFSYYVNSPSVGFCEQALTSQKLICSIGGTNRVEYIVEFTYKGFNEP